MKKEKKRPKAVKHLASSPNRKSKKAKSLKWITISILVLLSLSIVALLVSLFVLEPKAKKQNDNKKQLRLEVLTSSTINFPTSSIIDSTLGFTSEYDSSQLDAQGQVTDPQSTNNYVFGEEFLNEELNESRAYSIVKFRFKEKEEPIETGGEEIIIKPIEPELSIVTNIRKSYWDNRAAEPENQGLSKLDMAVNASKKSVLKDSTLTAGEPKEITLGDITYKQIEYTDNSDSFGVQSTYKQVTYVTVQNDRPYFITISFINNSNESQTKIFESIIAGIKYKPLGENTLAQSILNITEGKVAAATTEDLPSTTTKTPYDIDPETIFDVILKNQPSVVRVASFYCADIDLMNNFGGVGLNISQGCTGGVGSGSLISSDGYIATNGHVVSFTVADAVNGYIGLSKTRDELRDRVDEILSYLISIGSISSNETDDLINSAVAGDAEALNVLNSLGSLIPSELIKVKSEKSTFAIQTSNNPVKLNSARDSFEYNDTVIAATFVDKNFDPNENKNLKAINYTNNQSSDVAILKIDGNFPFIELGEITSIKEGDNLTAIGFPAFTDGALDTKQKTTPPTATQGEVEQIITKQVNQQKLVSTNVPIAQGNSGGPAFDVKGRQIGLNTYGTIECPDLKCFGNGTAVDVADLKALADKNSIKLKTDDSVNGTWQDALSSFEEGDYKAAVAGFKKVKKDYPANYLAEPLIKLASSKVGSASDISDGVFNTSNIVKAIGFLMFAGICFGCWYIVHLHNGHKKAFANTNNYYPAGGATPLPPNQPVYNQNISQPSQPVQNQPMTQQNVYVQPNPSQPSVSAQQVKSEQYVAPQGQPTVIQPTQKLEPRNDDQGQANQFINRH
jgi:S1-C subfamily serine protease